MNVALKQISALLSEEELVEKLPSSFRKVVAIELEESSEKRSYQLKGVSLETFDAESWSKYLYRRRAPNKPNCSPTCKLVKPDKKDKTKTAKECAATALNNKVMGYFDEMSKDAETTEMREFGAAVVAALKAEYEKALEEVTRYAEQIVPSKEDAIVSLVVYDSEGRKYAHSIKPVKEFFIQLSNPEARKLDGWRSKSKNGVCSCCGKKQDEVWCSGADLKLPYFTVDKPGFIANGFFDKKEFQEKGWRNFPLCKDCELAIRSGFKTVEEKLQFALCGVRYLLIPNFTDWQLSNVQSVVQTIAQLGKATETDLQRNHELLFAHRLSREESTASFTFVFYNKKPGRTEVLCTLENVLPSRMSELANAVDAAEQHRLLANFGEWTGATKIGSISINFSLLKGLYQPLTLFLRAVQRVVYGQPFDAREFFDAAMHYIRAELREQLSKGEEPRLTLATHKALAAAFWLLRLGLLRRTPSGDGPSAGTGDAMTNYPQLNEENLNERFDEFFQTFGGLFTHEEQCVCYLMGILCARVLYYQRRRYQNRQPFFRHLKDLNLDEMEMRGLLPKLKQKLVEYEKEPSNRGLEKAIAERFRLAGSPWQLTNSEINFFFTLGLCEAPLFIARAADEANTSEQEQ